MFQICPILPLKHIIPVFNAFYYIINSPTQIETALILIVTVFALQNTLYLSLPVVNPLILDISFTFHTALYSFFLFLCLFTKDIVILLFV